MFAELHWPLAADPDRDEIEDAVLQSLAGLVEVTGAGTGAFGSNLDLEFAADVDTEQVAESLAATLRGLGVPGARLRFEGLPYWTSLT